MSRPIPIVADVIAGDLARYGARRCFALLGTANFKIPRALVEAGVELIGVGPDPAVLGFLEDEGESVVEFLPGAEPNELVLAQFNSRLERVSEFVARS